MLNRFFGAANFSARANLDGLGSRGLRSPSQPLAPAAINACA